MYSHEEYEVYTGATTGWSLVSREHVTHQWKGRIEPKPFRYALTVRLSFNLRNLGWNCVTGVGVLCFREVVSEHTPALQRLIFTVEMFVCVCFAFAMSIANVWPRVTVLMSLIVSAIDYHSMDSRSKERKPSSSSPESTSGSPTNASSTSSGSIGCIPPFGACCCCCCCCCSSSSTYSCGLPNT
jgi:hypothetical protein